MDFREVGWGIDWINLVHVAGSFECGNEPLGSIKCRQLPE
jgi:hypothetical protein